MTTRYQVIIISPHLDDAVLSLAGTICSLVQQQMSCLVLNLFAGKPEEIKELSAVAAQYLQEDLGVDTVSLCDPVRWYETRLAEDIAALGALGVDHQNLDYLDAIFRGTPAYYSVETALFADVHPDDQQLVGAICDRIPMFGDRETLFFFPLGVGNHVDHQIAFLAGERLRLQGYRVRYYEEFPYCVNPAQVSKRIADLSIGLSGQRVDITEFLNAKIEAVCQYKSQIAALFQHEENIHAMLHRYSLIIADFEQDRFLERFWDVGYYNRQGGTYEISSKK
ncbi:hypothetical protein CBW65_04415 [Tumebacillus avium]|uniref:PIG-L family deacetylase n=1 Tax=Tumebacillus avium TaxID=1903704 RepID=A0A1Y0IM23_9BACL|nr:PIG-L family deacetylase [Tumebacillus avium]ARU60394.1 hypothetical protein CBW65_04415 [Tumebacillus avium]